MKRISATHEKIIITLKKYTDGNQNTISINRARYVISQIHRFPRPFNTRIINELNKIGAIKLNGPNGLIEILS